jgi:uracil-DNA glycosylase family 4
VKRRLARYDPEEHGARCSVCPLRKKHYVPPEGNPKAKYILVGEQPGAVEEHKRRPFQGPSGSLLDKLLYDVDLERDDAWVSNTILCKADRDDQFEEARLCCAPRLFRELKDLPPEAPLIALGKQAAKVLLGVGGILKSRGFIWKVGKLKAKARRELWRKVRDRSDKSKKAKTARATARLKLFRDESIARRCVLPTIHPAFVLRALTWGAVLQVDMDRISRFLKSGGKLDLVDRRPFKVAWKPEHVRRLAASLDSTVTVDIETDGVRILETRIRCIGIGDDKQTIVIYPFRKRLHREVLNSIFKRAKKIVGHNIIVFDAPVLRRAGIKMKDSKVEDTLVAYHAFASHLPKALLHVGSVFCDASPWKHEAKGEGKGEKGQPHKLPPAKLTRYNASDVQVTDAAWRAMQVDLRDEMHTYEADKRLQHICRDMQIAGFPFDKSRARFLDVKLERRASKLLRRMRDLVGVIDFNPDSPYDIRQVMFKRFGAPILLITPTGLPATGKIVLEQLKSDSGKIGKLAEMLLRYRSAQKTRSTFLSVYVGPDGKVHAGWRLGPVTGRLACRSPNLMNTPRYTPDKVTGVVDLCDRVRECYVARKGKVIVYFDLAQAEARFAANISGDKAFIKACAGDVHAGNAKVIFPEIAELGWLDGDEAKKGKGKPYRDVAKNSGFAIYYYAGWETVYERLIADDFPVSPADCRGILDAIHTTYTRYYEFVDENIAFVKQHHYLRTLGSKRIRWFGPYPKPTEVANTQVQSGIADYMNERLPKLVKLLPKKEASLIAQVHDSCSIECDVKVAEDVVGLIKQVFEPPVEIEGVEPFLIPVDTKVAERWSAL